MASIEPSESYLQPGPSKIESDESYVQPGTSKEQDNPLFDEISLSDSSDFTDAEETGLRKRLFHSSDLPEDTLSSALETHSADDFNLMDMGFPASAAEQAEHIVRKVIEEAQNAEQLVRKIWDGAWKVCHFSHLPDWLQDNDYLVFGHRPPLRSFRACFRSIFRIHTETGNIWTHLLGCLLFLGIAVYFLVTSSKTLPWSELLMFATFFFSCIFCLGMSFMFHTVSCHSEHVGKLFSKLDYCGIATLIIGSFVPWLYYGFYCEYLSKVIYFVLILVLGVACIIVSMWDKFSEPRFRWLRAGLFAGFGLSGVIPAMHYLIAKGFLQAVYHASFGWLCLMGALYLIGAALYALRVPERFFPGKCDIWFHSHQIFHVLVIAAAFVHYHGISEMAIYRLSMGTCNAEDAPVDFEY